MGEVLLTQRREGREYGLMALKNKNLAGFLSETIVEVILHEVNKAARRDQQIFIVKKGEKYQKEKM
eukprot:179163-Hanusia_phi.AAC.1